ncbi:hypothetical protein ACFLXQ_08220 [Chloroflexota bacterium]
MIRFIGWRVLLIAVVAVTIVFFFHLGMRMVDNPNRWAQPNYDLLIHSRVTWQQTRVFIADAIRGDLGAITTRRDSVPVREMLVDTYFGCGFDPFRRVGLYLPGQSEPDSEGVLRFSLDSAAGQVEGRLSLRKPSRSSDQDSFRQVGIPAMFVYWEKAAPGNLPAEFDDEVDNWPMQDSTHQKVPLLGLAERLG